MARSYVHYLSDYKIHGVIRVIELHEGSIVKANNRHGGKTMVVKRLLEHSVEEKRMVVLDHDGEGMEYELLKDCDGEPITQGWLNKFGIPATGELPHNSGFTIIQSTDNKVFWDLWFLGKYTGECYQFVHELQNLYFGLTREPLRLKPILDAKV
jgi:hypothetical protein